MTLPCDLFISAPGNNINLKNDEDLNLSFNRNSRGDDRLTFQLCNWRNRLPRLGDDVILRDPTYGIAWSGYVGRVQPGGFFGSPAKIEARGWHHTIDDDGWDETKVYEEGTNFRQVIESAMSRMSGGVHTGIPLPAALSTTQLTEDSPDFMLKTPADVYDYICDKLKYLGTPLMWEVRQSIYNRMMMDPNLYVRFVDLAARYQVRLTENDDPGIAYDTDTVFNKAIVGWSPKLAETHLTPSGTLYGIIPRIRSKRVNATNDLNDDVNARNLAQHLVNRNNTYRPVDSVMSIHCDTPIEAQYPVVDNFVPAIPHWMVINNFYIRVLNPFVGWGPYTLREFWISDLTYDFDSNNLRLSLGDPISYDDFALRQSYQVNRVNSALDSGIVNQPLRDADAIQVIGPDKAGDSPPTIGEVIPMAYLDQDGNFVSIVDPDKPALPFGAVIHPKVLPDYGVQVNFGREADSIGTKGFIQVIPCKVLAWNVCFTPPAGSDTVPTDSITIELYPTYPFTVGANILATCILAAEQCESGLIAPTPASLASFAQRGKIGVRVSSRAATTGAGFQIAVTGKRVYPDIGVTT